jgi:glycosyltransferase involved in cell wall biosynthesis
VTAGRLITVGLPVFNGERFLEDAVGSILAQRDVDFELIISDNASTDETETVCRDVARRDDRVRYVRHATNRGAARNYNDLVNEARGVYFKWAAHDDICAPTFLSRCADALDDDPSVVLAYPRAADIDENGNVVKAYPSIRYATSDNVVDRARSALAAFTPCFESFGLMRTAVLRRTRMIGPYTSSDRTLFFELALHGRFYEVDERLFLHRQHAGRSVFSHTDARTRDAWFDPNRSSERSSPRFRLLCEHARAIQTGPLTRRERARIATYLPRLAVRYSRPLMAESARWVVHAGHDLTLVGRSSQR